MVTAKRSTGSPTPVTLERLPPLTGPHMRQAALFAALSLSVPTLAAAQNDECVGAIALTNGVATTFDTTSATPSATPWLCVGSVAPDLWYSFTPTTSGVSVSFSTCGSSYDTAIEVFDGACTALNPIACNDNSCGLQSTLSLPSVTAGQTYYVRVGGVGAGFGLGTLTATEGSPPASGCVLNPGFETGDLGGWSFTDLPLPFFPGQVNAAGISPGFGLFPSDPTEGTFALTHGFDGDVGTIILSQDVLVSSGLTPLSFDYRAGWDMLLTGNATLDRTFDVVVRDPSSGAALQTSNLLTATANTTLTDTGPMNGSVDLATFLGQTVTVSFEWTIPEIFTGPAFFQLDNITCPAGGGFGANFCGPAVPNSTGQSGVMSAAGSLAVTSNDLTISASELPANSFAFFLTSTGQNTVFQPGGSQGVLCLGGAIGRFVGPGQIVNTGVAGAVSLALDLSQHPTPTGFVQIQPGETWNFQAWFRDAVGGQVTSNFTDGIELTFN